MADSHINLPCAAALYLMGLGAVLGVAGTLAGGAVNAAEELRLSQDEQPTLWQQERTLLRAVENAQGEYGPLSGALIPPLRELASFYIANMRCESAVPILMRALQVSRATGGLFNPQQMQLLDPLLECYLSLDLQDEFKRELAYTLLLAEQTYGRDSPNLIPALMRTARWHEQAGRYISARNTYNRAVKLARKAGGKRDVRMVEPLLGITRAFRLEYVHGLHDADDKQYLQDPLRSKARLKKQGDVRLDLAGWNAINLALKVLRSHPDAPRNQLVETLLELADWNHMEGSLETALSLYKEAWRESAAGDYSGPPLFIKPEPIFYRPESATLVRRVPYQQENYDHYWVDFNFTVTRRGFVRDVTVTDSNAPRAWQKNLARDFENVRYRPQFEAGKPIDTPGCSLRQGLYVERGTI